MTRGLPGLGVLLKHLWTDGTTLNRTMMNLELARAPELHGVVLDVGAGQHPNYWQFLRLAAGTRVLTLDIVPENRPRVVADVQQALPFRERTIDTVLLLNVLEHLFDQRRPLREASRVLRPGGVLLLAIPFLIGVHTKAERGLLVDDFFRLTRSSLLRLLGEEGEFDHVEIVAHGGLFLSILNLLQPALKLRPLWVAAAGMAYLMDLLVDRRFPANREKWVIEYVVIAHKAR